MTHRYCDCGARLSRYNPDDYCSVCDLARDTSYEDYFSSIAHTVEGRLRGKDTCKRGHDLLEHGTIVHASGGRMTRRCAICRMARQREYARNRRARERKLQA